MDRVSLFCGLPQGMCSLASAIGHKCVGWDDHQERLPFLLVLKPFRSLLVFLVLFVCPASSQAQSQPAIFAVFQGDHGLGCCNNNLYNLSTGGNTQFVQSGESITGSFGDASLAINLHIFEDGATTDGDGGRVDVYVLGPPGTPFQLQYTYTQRASAINQSSGGYLTTIFFQGFQSFGFQVSPGSSNQKNVSGGDTVVGMTSAQTITYLGQTYSLAWSAGHLIEVGANTCCGSYTGHAEADLNFSVTLISNCTFGIVPSTAGVDALGDTASVALTASQPTCAWTASSNATWLTVTTGASGSGSGPVGYTAAANLNNAPRQGTLTIGGQVFTVTQPGVVVSLEVPPAVRPSFTPAPPTFGLPVPAGPLISIKATATAKDTAGQLIQAPLLIDFSVQPDPDGMRTAGHCHVNLNDLAALLVFVDDSGSPNSVCKTGQDAPGQCHVLWIVDDESGAFNINAALDANPTIGASQQVTVAIGGLSSIATTVPLDPCTKDEGSGPGYTLVGQFGTDAVQSIHYQNHFGTPRLVTTIKQLASQYFSANGKTLKINDMSLKSGGLFDIDNHWTTPHDLHRDGNSVDINRQNSDGSGVDLNLLNRLAWEFGMCRAPEKPIHFDFLIHGCKIN